jgi:S1-C subfamily serine protease
VGSNAPLDIRPEAQRPQDAVHHPPHHEPHIDVIELHRTAHDRPKGSPKSSSEPKDFNYGSIDEVVQKNVTDRRNHACATDPKRGEVPVLRAGGDSKGCEYTNAGSDPLAVSIYNKHSDQTVHMFAASESGNRKGSGVIVEKGKDTCLVLSDVHVTNSLNVDPTISSMNATTASGEKFPATLRKIDPKTDLSLVTVKTGKDTDRVCKPAKIAKDDRSAASGNDLVTLGYPDQSSTVYASPGVFKSKSALINNFGEPTKMRDHPWVSYFSPIVKGEDTGRPVIEQEAQVYGGMSGGPTFNKRDEVVGVTSRTKGSSHALTTPVTQETIRELKK